MIGQYQSARDSDGIASVPVARIDTLMDYTFEYVDSQNDITVFPGEAVVNSNGGWKTYIRVDFHMYYVIMQIQEDSIKY